ncbi:UvrD-helicase domain-containing protein [Brevibacillus centrosporus]|uniref:UvrD-helicase domain-containing protein n=1 Tax=Brevibacillus centrosporus TaxID=54910 RepID=UPI002E224B35|nr:UvrD-helicase domain-containing protein [Brevibacillus centrosporus]MED4909396.1 UvrD-helicase domain-containing protein [Brevibacillus centrosporus]
MFIQTSLRDAPGLAAELIVWKAIERAFDGNNTLAIHHFPMFFSNGAGRREIDILLVNELIGVCVIEVKGLNIRQIMNIQGHVWSYNDFYEDQGSPYQQAELQMNMLCNHLEKEPLLYRRLSKRAFVALPYITEQEWRERGFHEQLNVPVPLFKDDFADLQRLMSKLQQYSVSRTDTKLTKLEMKKIAHELGIQQPESTQAVLRPRQPFSCLYVMHTKEEFINGKQEIEKTLLTGTKVYVLSYEELDEQSLAEYKKHKDEFQFNYYEANKATADKVSSHCYIDGENLTNETLDQLSSHFPSFNIGQYKAVHQPIDAHQIITAGAGTGKTHVMIDRILFLLMNGGVLLNKITMITFTNASTNEMKKRLEEKFLVLFNLTRQAKFLHYAEQVKDMQISTIHSFARSILMELAHEMGYGKNVQLRSYVFAKKGIIQELLDEYHRGQSVDTFLKTRVKDYDFIDLVYEMWEEIEKKGLTNEDVLKLDWGRPIDTNSAVIQEMLRNIFSQCEMRLDELKRKENAITMGDLIRKLKLFTQSDEKMQQLPKDRYMFVDEFQDSDAVQIELLASLQKYLKYHLFVVGDIKQAIYRFRGADYKSFQELKQETTGTEYQETELQLNYRTSSSLLNLMHPLFERWHKNNWLQYEEKDRLLSNKKSQFAAGTDWKVTSDYKQYFHQALSTLPKEDEKIAIIVRTNRHAKQVKEYCVSKGIPTTENLDGTFFTSPSVIQFKALVEGLLYPGEPKYLINALRTPYFDCVIPYQALIPFGGHKERLVQFIHERTNNELKDYARSLRTLAPMTLIQTIIRKNDFFKRLPHSIKQQLMEENPEQELTQGTIDLAVQRYEKNLQHLMILIERNFSSQRVSLSVLRDWLQLQISTNRTENEPVLERNKAKVEITTVHRSKGLEYHTVFIPITQPPFNTVQQPYFLEENSEESRQAGRRKLGWSITVNAPGYTAKYYNSHFGNLKQYEDEEQLKEETRLLYVALTRAKQRVYIAMPKRTKIKENSWAYILEHGGLIDGLETY